MDLGSDHLMATDKKMSQEDNMYPKGSTHYYFSNILAKRL